MKNAYSWEQIEKWRDKVHRRTARRAVRTKGRALDFIREVGFCFAFRAEHSELPCLWNAVCGERNPVVPHHTHHDPAISFVWEMKDILPSEGKIYYGKLLRGRPTMVSLEYLPFFFALSEHRALLRDGGRLRRGELSPLAREILETLDDSWPQSTRGLKIATGQTTAARRQAFDRAIADLQGRMAIVKVAEEYDPFGFVWAPIGRAFPGLARRVRTIAPEAAREKILKKYFENQFVATVDAIQRLFGWGKPAIYAALGALTRRGVVTNGIRLDGGTRKFYCLVETR
jgi:hypothetical protein